MLQSCDRNRNWEATESIALSPLINAITPLPQPPSGTHFCVTPGLRHAET